MENKYYTPSIEEFRVGFECEMNTTPMNWIHTRITLNHFKHIDKWLKDKAVRVRFLDKEDLESLGFEQTVKNQWVGWNDYVSNYVNPNYGYYLYVTLHFPRSYVTSDRLEHNLFKIIAHRYFCNEDIENLTNVDEKIKEDESRVLYEGLIKNLSELKQALTMIGVDYVK